MAFFKKNKFLLVFLNNAELKLAVYSQSSKGMERLNLETLEFSPDIVKDSSILNGEVFSDQVFKLLETRPEWKGAQLLLVIPEEKIFIKGLELELGDLEKRAKLRESFITEVPFLEGELIVRERLIGRVLEFSAVHKKFLSDFQKPFIEAQMDILGLVSVPHAIALNLNPSEKSFLLAFYDNNFALVLAENASVIFSETWRLSEHKVKEAVRAFDHFVQHLRVVNIKSISIILGEDVLEDALKIELENRDYMVKEIKKIGILDLIADYYFKNKTAEKDWNMLYVEENGFLARMKKQKKILLILLGFIIAVVIALGAWRLFAQKIPPASKKSPPEINMPVKTAATSTGIESVGVKAATPIAVSVNKADFPINILNGTTIAGEAGRLKSVLDSRGFAVASLRTNEDQRQVLTTIFVNVNVPDALISELRLILESRYKEVLVSPSPVVSGDIQIVIGREK